MSAIYSCETRKHSWWGPMPAGYQVKINGELWNGKDGYSISDAATYEVDLFRGALRIDATATISFNKATKICLFIGQALENNDWVRKHDFVIAYGSPPLCNNADQVQLLWRPCPDWMANIKGNPLLSEINIPGSHDSCAVITYGWIDESGVHWNYIKKRGASCQNFDLPTQLYAGIRFLDIRLKLRDGELKAYHGSVCLSLSFEHDIVEECLTYLDAHSKETIIMSIKNETSGDDTAFALAVEKVIGQSYTRWHTANETPTLDDARNKIVLIRRYQGHQGINAAVGEKPDKGWQEDAVFTLNDEVASAQSKNKLRVQDCYKVEYTPWGFNAKWNKIQEIMEEAGAGNRRVWYLNFSSGSTYTDPCDVANGGFLKLKGMNQRLEEFLSNKEREKNNDRIGTILMDFLDHRQNQLVPLIVDSNHW